MLDCNTFLFKLVYLYHLIIKKNKTVSFSNFSPSFFQLGIKAILFRFCANTLLWSAFVAMVDPCSKLFKKSKVLFLVGLYRQRTWATSIAVPIGSLLDRCGCMIEDCMRARRARSELFFEEIVAFWCNHEVFQRLYATVVEERLNNKSFYMRAQTAGCVVIDKTTRHTEWTRRIRCLEYI